MQIAELVLKFIQALAWPLVTTILAWLFRRQLQQMFSRVTRLETPAGAMDFAAEARAVHEEAAEIETPGLDGDTSEEAPERRDRHRSVMDEALEVLDTSPNAAVVLGWRQVEATYRRVLSGNYDLRDAPFIPVGRAIQQLSELGLPSSSSSLIIRLSSMRNRVAHGDASVTAEAALDYLESCELVSRQLETLAPVWVPNQELPSPTV
ncbi:hypothetical protein OG223_28135 [Streptomyces sp. NBC_01478]|uniref:hypothetical protein n=1 Tax=Streptomyces sp. NBC_01478 TaxID=2903882 RepID=UPI002E332F09|nr:hypothetical protein [Streptomyces sp. NBC_01478]